MLNSISNQAPIIFKQLVLPELTSVRITNLALVALACIRFIAIPLAQRLFSKPVDEIKVRELINNDQYVEARALLKSSHDKALWQKLILNVANDIPLSTNDEEALSIIENYIKEAPAKLRSLLYEHTLLFYVKVKPESNDLIKDLIESYLNEQTKHLRNRDNQADLTTTINHLLDVQKNYLDSSLYKKQLDEEPKKKHKGLKKREPLLQSDNKQFEKNEEPKKTQQDLTKRELVLKDNIKLLEAFEFDLRKDISKKPNSYSPQFDQNILNKIDKLKSELQSAQVEFTTQNDAEGLIIHSISDKITKLMTELMTSKNIDKPKVIDKPNALKLYLKIYNNYSDYSPKQAYTAWQNNILPICSDKKLQPKEQLELILIVATIAPELLDEQGIGAELCQIVFDLAKKPFDATYFEQLCFASCHCLKNIADSQKRLLKINELEKILEDNKKCLTEKVKLNIYHAFAASLSKKIFEDNRFAQDGKNFLASIIDSITNSNLTWNEKVDQHLQNLQNFCGFNVKSFSFKAYLETITKLIPPNNYDFKVKFTKQLFEMANKSVIPSQKKELIDEAEAVLKELKNERLSVKSYNDYYDSLKAFLDVANEYDRVNLHKSIENICNSQKEFFLKNICDLFTFIQKLNQDEQQLFLKPFLKDKNSVIKLYWTLQEMKKEFQNKDFNNLSLGGIEFDKIPLNERKWFVEEFKQLYLKYSCFPRARKMQAVLDQCSKTESNMKAYVHTAAMLAIWGLTRLFQARHAFI